MERPSPRPSQVMCKQMLLQNERNLKKDITVFLHDSVSLVGVVGPASDNSRVTVYNHMTDPNADGLDLTKLDTSMQRNTNVIYGEEILYKPQ